MVKDLLVTIWCATYNHEKFIRQCLDGFVNQITNFEYEILVHDDASTDNTAKIVKEYEVKFPYLFHCVYQTVNQYSKYNTLIHILSPLSRGKYIALCDGDDYWTDPLKLQKQVDFLKENPEFSLSFHKVKVKYEDNLSNAHVFENLEEREYNGHEIYSKWSIPTCTVMFRNHITTYFPQWVVYGDIFLFLSLAEKGRIYCQGFEGSVYRRNIKGLSVTLSTDTIIRLYYQYHYMIDFFPVYSNISRQEKFNYFSYLINRPYDDKRLIKFRFLNMLRNPRKILSRYSFRTIKMLFINPEKNLS